jgi:hypothetical protein
MSEQKQARIAKAEEAERARAAMGEFVPFPKIGRLSREIIVTEKIDGTNALIAIGEDGSMKAGSRTQWITPQADNHGFARWVEAHRAELLTLGPGRHFGEWWGTGIQRNYHLSEKRFSLFNVRRWDDGLRDPAKPPRPACCHVVPILEILPFDTTQIERVMADLAARGSRAAPGFMKPEGIVIFHSQSGALFKKTFEKDDAGKGKEPEREIAA